MNKFTTKWHESIKTIREEDWNNLVFNNSIPVYQWRWLYYLEKSNSITAKFGWQPLYLAISRGKKLIGVAPLFIKGHSYGEFIFDHQFYQLANDLNINYYPKLVGMSPVSPIEGYRFLISEEEDEENITSILLSKIDDLCIKNNINSCNFLYADSSWAILLEKSGCARWINQNSIWNANECENFNDYLLRFNSNQRRNIKRERQSINKAGINISIKNGNEINVLDMQLMHNFYEQHCSRWGSWGSKYLSKDFFKEIALSSNRDHLVLFSANQNLKAAPLAMSFCLRNKNMLWGRYWGSNTEIDFLHFELCYYSPIEWSLKQGIKSFDPGAGGAHKRRRGFLAKPLVSLHKWYDPRMDKIIRIWLPKVNNLMMQEIKATNNEVPFKVEVPKLCSR